MSVIYMAINDVNLKGYIGKTKNINKRMNQHLCDSNKNSQLYFHRAIRKYGFDNFTWIVLEECDDYESNDREMYYISLLGGITKLYNMTRGGDGGNTLGNHPNKKEIFRKMSESNRGDNHFTSKMTIKQYEEFCHNRRGENNYLNKMSPENRENFINDHWRGENNPMYGRSILNEMSDEDREQYIIDHRRGENNPMHGRKHSDEIRQKMSENSKGKNSGSVNCNYGKKGSDNHRSKKYVLTFNDTKIVVVGIGYFVEEYNKHSNIKIFSQLLSAVASGKNKSHRGIVCEYYDDNIHGEIPLWDNKIIDGQFKILVFNDD